tara:strand:- start:1490 stop:2086 length:597 start_codon:yes stop_codon:yes gene_type:complete
MGLYKIDQTTRRALVESLNLEQFKAAVEVGVRTGWFSKYILDNTQMKVYAIDPWEDNSELTESEDVFAECQERLAPYGERAEMIKGYSPAAADLFSDESVDFVYIDALHDYESVKKDIEAWWPKVKRGGVISGHDYNRLKWPGVVKAVKEFCKEKGVTFSLTGILDNGRTSRRGDFEEFDGDEASWFAIKDIAPGAEQ